jgi:ABC-type Fe3+ transport system substrate-binding protein
MSHTPRSNWFIISLFGLAAIGVFVASLLLPSFRVIAYAPLRDLILPPPKPVIISVLYSTEKQAWLTDVVAGFEASRPMVNGHPVQVQLEAMGSREIYLAVLDGSRQPDVISPASSLQISILQDQSTGKFGHPVVNVADTTNCRSVVTTPLVLTAWKERASVLWNNQPGANLWQQLHDVAVDPQGWNAFGHPEWGYFKFGHTNPLSSNSGFMTILLMTYSYYGKTDGLTSSDILSNTDYQKWFLDFEHSMSQFEVSTGPLMNNMITYGPSMYDMVAVYEATAIEQASNAVGRYGELHIYYPPAAVWSDHPFCILQADWVTPDKTKAAQAFIDYLISRPVQETALLKYGFRPVDKSIPLDQPSSPIQQYSANGFKADLSSLPTVVAPPGDVLSTLLDFWSRNMNR